MVFSKVVEFVPNNAKATTFDPVEKVVIELSADEARALCLDLEAYRKEHEGDMVHTSMNLANLLRAAVITPPVIKH